MSVGIAIRTRADIGREKWDAFVDASDEAWLWHRWDFIDALALWPGYQDLSLALVDREKLVAVMPMHRVTVRLAGIIPLIRLTSLGGPAVAASVDREKILSVLRDHLLDLIAESGAISVEAQIAPLTPWLESPAGPMVNPLVLAGFENTQTETWILDLSGMPAEIRSRYSELTRRELRKASKSDIQLREAFGAKDLETYYRLHLETYARTKVRPHPIGYFLAIFEKFQPLGLARILFAERGGVVVAAQNTALYKRGAVYWTGASLSEKEGGENRTLFDAQIMAARTGGCIRYETGQAFVNSGNAKEQGLSRFKRSFGADIRPYYRGVLHSPRMSIRALSGLRDVVRSIHRARS